MVTRLNQTRVKGGDPQYENLQEELRARTFGGDYKIPIGGIPRSDLSDDVRTALQKGESAYMKPEGGIPNGDLDVNVRNALTKASTSYQKPNTGIPLADLTEDLQKRLSDFSNFYVYPTGGIPLVDFDTQVKDLLSKAKTAYQKPADGINTKDLHKDVLDTLAKAKTAYQKPEGGIPLTDLAVPIVQAGELEPMEEHIKDASKHITDHTKLLNVGKKTHDEIDASIDNMQNDMILLQKEMSDARDTFVSLDGRFNASIGRNTSYEVKTYNDWRMGGFTGLQPTKEDLVVFNYPVETVMTSIHDISKQETLTADNKVGDLAFLSYSGFRPGSEWLPGYGTNVGVKVKAYVYAPITGEYQFSMQFSGRCRLQVAGKLLFDTRDTSTPIDAYTGKGSVFLEGGKLYPIVGEGWYKTTNTRVLTLQWSTPAMAGFTNIPLENMNMSGYTNKDGVYESHVIDLKDAQVNMWYLQTVMRDYLQEDDVTSEICTSDDGDVFSEWVATESNGEIRVPPKQYIKVRHTLHKRDGQYTPALISYSIRMISARNNEIIKELSDARATFDSLQKRLDNMAASIQTIGELYNNMGESFIHPEQFASVRLLAIELNLLQTYIREARTKADYMPIVNGFVDPFKNDKGIDRTKSDAFNITANGLVQVETKMEMKTSNDWAQWDLDRLDFAKGELTLGANYNAYPVYESKLSNRKYDTSYDVDYGDGYKLAQAFYPKDESQFIKSFTFYGGMNGYSTNVSMTIYEDVNRGYSPGGSVIYSQSYVGGTSTYTLNHKIKPGAKYWVVFDLQSASSGTRFYCSNLANADPRLISDNPEKAMLKAWFRPFSGREVFEPVNACLNFEIVETIGYEPEGNGEKIIDHGRPLTYVKSEVTAADINDGAVNVTYQSSDNKIDWSPETTKIEELPASRYLKIKVNMKKSTKQYGTPRLQNITLYTLKKNAEIVSVPLTAERLPTHIILSASSSRDSAVSYAVSRDDGKTWLPCLPAHYAELSKLPPGKTIRVKAIMDAKYPDTALKEWGVIGLHYRDVTGQNITALYEEYTAQDGQTIFHLENPYPMGNHALQVFVNGIRQSIWKDYKEIDQHTIEFTEGLYNNPAGVDRVTFVVATGAYDIHDSTLVSRIENMERLHQEELVDYEKIHEYNEAGQLIKTKYEGTLEYYTIEYTYYDNGKEHFRIVTKGNTIKTTEYIYDKFNNIVMERVKISEVTSA